jgi:hypothetical protein
LYRVGDEDGGHGACAPLPTLQICYGLRRFTRKDKVASPRATKQPDGQIKKILSSPLLKNIPLPPSGKSGA